MKKLLRLSLILAVALLLVGCNAETTTTTQADLAPTILGVSDKTVEVGSSELDLLEGITVTDDFDTDLISSVTISGVVDYETVGDYDITLTVTDSSDNETTETFTVTVTPSADELAALADIEAINISQDADGNYVLPTSGSVNGSTIIWTTDRPDVITKRGFVIKPGLDAEAVTVTLTANVIKNKFRTTVDFEFTVEPHTGVNGVTSTTSLAFEGTSEEYVVAPQEAVDIFFVDNGNLPYIDVETFVNMIDGAIDSELLTFTPVGTDQLRVEYDVEYEDFDSSMVTESFWALIDFTENTFTVNNFSFFENYVASTTSDYGEGLTYVDAYYVDGQEVTIPLGYYNFDILTHQVGEDTKYLMPLHVVNLLFAGNIYYDVYYNGDKLWGVDTFIISGSTEEEEALLNSTKTSSFNEMEMPEDIRWATYNFYALALDYFYGLRDRYDVDSMYEVIAEHASDMINGNDREAYAKVFRIAYDLDDLHTSHVFPGYYEVPYTYTVYQNDLGPRTMEFYNGLWGVQDLLTAKYGSPDDLPTQAVLLDNDTTAVIYLTGFTIDTPDDFKAIMDTLPATVENVVVDLTYNTGGNLGAVLRIFGYMTEETIMYHSQNPADGAAVSYYIESDYVAYDYEWYIATSSVTFSAANLMASIAKELGIATVIGKNSSGGASSIGAIFSPDGSCLLISTNNVLSTRIGDSPETYEYLSIEDGIEVDFLMSNVTSDTALINAIKAAEE